MLFFSFLKRNKKFVFGLFLFFLAFLFIFVYYLKFFWIYLLWFLKFEKWDSNWFVWNIDYFPKVANYFLNRKIYSWTYGSAYFLTGNFWFKKFAEWNSLFFNSLKKLEKSWFNLDLSGYYSIYNNLEKAIDLYSEAISFLSWNFSTWWLQRINYNKQKAEQLKFLVWMNICWLKFNLIFGGLNSLLESANRVEKNLNEVINILKQKIKDLKDPSLKHCFETILRVAQISLVNLTDIKLKILEYKKNASVKFFAYIKDPEECLNKEDFFIWVLQWIKDMKKWLDNYSDQYWKLYAILKFWNDYYYRKLCSNLWKLSSKFWKNNDKLSKGLSKLKEYLWNKSTKIWWKNNKKKKFWKNRNWQKENIWKKHWQDQSNWKEKNWNSNLQNNKWWWEKAYHYPIPLDEIKRIIKSIKNKSNLRINKMQSIKWNPKYNPNKFLDNLFRYFYWNRKGFSVERKEEGY